MKAALSNQQSCTSVTIHRIPFLPAVLAAALAWVGGSALAQSTGGQPLDQEAHPPLHVRPNAFTSPVGYVPLQIINAYGIDLQPNDGTGQVIALVEAYGSPTLQNDLNVFCQQFGLPTTTVQIVYGSGPKPRKTDSGWALETSLDVEWAHALAPKAKIIVAVASSANISNLISAVDAAVKAGATTVSMSWGGSEFSTEANYESHFRKTGVAFFASSGDNGAGTEWPAASPSVTGVGGTSLYLDASGNRISPETGWSGSGGGLSIYFLRPAFQNGWQSSSYRAIPDVALVADPNTGVTVYDSTPYSGQSGWFEVGGTSAGSPMWAAIVALADQERVAGGKPPLTGADVQLYALAGSTSSTGAYLYGYYFFDVTSGSNGAFSSTPNFDEVTGLGTPFVGNLVGGLANY